MRKKRKIIEIDEEKCDGCGQCILSCMEGALALVNGKARLVGEFYCDGLGACIGECPQGALKIGEREAEAFNEKAVRDHLKKLHLSSPQGENAPGVCPGSSPISYEKSPSADPDSAPENNSALSHWPIKLQLLGPGAQFLQGADLLLLADCAAAAFPGLHRKLLPGRVAALGCPKLDDLEAHISRLAEILKVARPRSLTVAHMEVPCCRGFVFAAEEALKRSGLSLPLNRIMISREGKILEEEVLKAG